MFRLNHIQNFKSVFVQGLLLLTWSEHMQAAPPPPPPPAAPVSQVAQPPYDPLGLADLVATATPGW